MRLKERIQNSPWMLAVAVTLLVAVWMLSGTLTREPAETGESVTIAGGTGESALTRVQVSTQIAEPVTRFISVYGSTAPVRSVELNAETDGRVESIDAERGQRISVGSAILRLDMRDRQARLEQTRASVNQHQTSYEAQMKLKAEGYVSDTQIAETVAMLEAARAELKRAQLDLEYRVLRAPFDGVLQDREVEVGDFVRSGDVVATFIDNTSIVVTGTIAEQDGRYVANGDIAQAKLVTGPIVEGRIRYIAPVADASTRTFTVEMEVPNPGGRLPAGITAEMLIPAQESPAQKISPSLLSLDANGIIGVKTVDDFNRVVFSTIDIVRSDPDGVWVTGLPETAKIIIVGQGYVAAGQEIEPVMTESKTALAAEQLN